MRAPKYDRAGQLIQKTGAEIQNVMEVTTGITEEVDVICGSLKAKLRVNDLCDGRSRCVLLGESVLTPCDYERTAGTGSKNWKRSVRYRGKPLIHFLEYRPYAWSKNATELFYKKKLTVNDYRSDYFELEN